MERYVVVTDSTANLPPELAEVYAVPEIPLTVHWDGEDYVDGVTLDAHTFYSWLQERSSFPTTSQPSPGAFIEFFQKVSEEYQTKNIIGVFISSDLSGTLASAVQAKAQLPDLEISLVDSRFVSMGHGFQVMAAVDAVREGLALDAILERIRQVRDSMSVVFAVDTLEYLHRGGRIGGAARLLGTALSLKPVLQIASGKVMPLEKVRKRRKSLQRVVEIAAERLEGRTPTGVAIIHAEAGDDVALVEHLVKARLGLDHVHKSVLTPVVGTHGGPGTLGLAFYAVE